MRSIIVGKQIPVPVSRKPAFSSLVRIIIGQQLSGKAAETIWRRLEEALPGKTISQLHYDKLSDWELRKIGVSHQKKDYIRNLSKLLHANANFFEDLSILCQQKCIEELKKIKGIGDWSASIFAMSAFGHLDVLAKNDATIKKTVIELYGEDFTEDSENWNELMRKWSPYRTVACRVLWHWADGNL